MASPALRERLMDRAADRLALSTAEALAEPLAAIRDLEQLASGWITSAQRGLAPRNPVGTQDLIYGDNPAPAASWSYQVDGSSIIYPQSVYCELATSGVAGERAVTVEYQDGSGRRWVIAGAPVTAGPGDTHAYNWYAEAPIAFVVDDAVLAPLHQQYLYPTHSLVVQLSNAQAGDQLSAVRLSVERFRLDELT